MQDLYAFKSDLVLQKTAAQRQCCQYFLRTIITLRIQVPNIMYSSLYIDIENTHCKY